MSTLKTIRLPVSANIKLALVLLALVIAGGTLFYTQMLVTNLRNAERETAHFYANFIQTYGNMDAPSAQISELHHQLTQQNTITFPIIQTNPQKQIDPMVRALPGGGADTSYEGAYRNIAIDTNAPAYLQLATLEGRREAMAAEYEPLPIYYVTAEGDSTLLSYLFYDDSDVIKQLGWLPYIEVILGAMFMFVGYLSFSHIKKNEQSNIWVGMAKETAHQLGTPLSSLLGWIELLRLMPEDTEQVLEAANEMERDVERLNKVAQRFSKIGSAAEVRTVEINEVLRHVVQYFERRLPHLGKRVVLTLEPSPPVYVNINIHLFEWVFENLVRNAADAMDRADGKITFRIQDHRGHAVIDVQDNGRGIDPKVRNDIFRPGFSTKQRGWGLGLSLARRIVEEYHGGKIAVKESSPEGTTFRIRLTSVPAPATTESGTNGRGVADAATAISKT